MGKYMVWVIRNNMPSSPQKTIIAKESVQGVAEARSRARDLKTRFPNEAVIYFLEDDINEVV